MAAHIKMLIDAHEGRVDEMTLSPWQFEQLCRFRQELIEIEHAAGMKNLEMNELVEGLAIEVDVNKLHGYGESRWDGTTTEPLVAAPVKVEKVPVGAVLQYQQPGGTDWEPAADPLGPDHWETVPLYKSTPRGDTGHWPGCGCEDCRAA